MVRIDPHVHCRDDNQSYKETIPNALKIADEQGIDMIFDMPNTDPLIVSESAVKERLKLVPDDDIGRYFLYIGATSEPKQLEGAVHVWKKYLEVIGIKMFAGRSVGDLTISDGEGQKRVYETLANLGYTGVIAVHCEKEDLFKPDEWDPNYPISHSFARPPEAEVESIKDQIKFVKETGFKGNLHVCHISCPYSVELVDNARSEIKITCAATPHHIMWNSERQNSPGGMIFKMNPPLRTEEERRGLEEYLKGKKIDWIETDHAPHQIGEKLFHPYLSGFPSLYLYKRFVEEYLPNLGIGADTIESLTYGNIIKAFGSKIEG